MKLTNRPHLEAETDTTEIHNSTFMAELFYQHIILLGGGNEQRIRPTCPLWNPTRLTFEKLLELRLVHVVRDVTDKELVGVGVPDQPATF